MNRLMFVSLAVVAMCGCRSVTVKNYGQEAVTVDGKTVVLSRGWHVSHWQHWMTTKTDTITANIKPEEIAFGLNGLDSKPDGEGLASVVKESLSGAATLATKIGAAIATAGGTACADSISGLVQKFVSAGGDASKAKVECANGTCTITDGTTTCSDGSCYYTAAE